MKITVSLSQSEVKGIREYLKEIHDIENPTKTDIQEYVNNIVQIINSPKESVSDYINKFN